MAPYCLGAVVTWVKVLLPKRLGIRIPDPPVTLVANGNLLSSGSLPRLTYWGISWFYVTPSLRVMISDSHMHTPRTVDLSDYEVCYSTTIMSCSRQPEKTK